MYRERWRLIPESHSSLFHDMFKALLVIAIVLILALLVSNALLGQLSSFHLIGTKGNMKALGAEAYWDQNLTNRTETIDWGTVLAGSSRNVTLYIRSVSNMETTLGLMTANWTLRASNGSIVAGPSESSPYMNLTWNYNGAILQPGETIQATLTLSTSYSPEFVSYLVTNDVKGFDFDILIGPAE